MASGSFQFTNGQLIGIVSWSSETNIADNTSTVNATLYVSKDNTIATTGTFSGSLTVGTGSKNGSYYGSVSDSWYEICSYSKTITHDSSGAGSCYLAGSVSGPSGTSLAGKTASGSRTITLDTIPRQATLSSAPNFNDEENPTITYSNPAGNAVSSLQACIADSNGSVIYVPYRDISKTGTSYTFPLTTAERNTLRNVIPNSKSMTVKFYIKCVIGSNTYYSSLAKTFSIINGQPTFTPKVEDVNSLIVELTGNKDILVKYHSYASVNIGAIANKGSTIVSQQVSNDANVITSSTGTIYGIESGKFVFTATDSRGNTGSYTLDKPFVDYVKLTCNFKPKVSLDGVITFNISGNYFNGSFGKVNNTLKIAYRYKTAGGSYGSWTYITPTISGNEYEKEVSFTLPNFNYKNSYTFQTMAVDKLTSIYSVEYTVKALPVFDWSADDFVFNVPVYLGNTELTEEKLIKLLALIDE